MVDEIIEKQGVDPQEVKDEDKAELNAAIGEEDTPTDGDDTDGNPSQEG